MLDHTKPRFEKIHCRDAEPTGLGQTHQLYTTSLQ